MRGRPTSEAAKNERGAPDPFSWGAALLRKKSGPGGRRAATPASASRAMAPGAGTSENVPSLSVTGAPKALLWLMRSEIVFAACPSASTNCASSTRPFASARPCMFSVRWLYQPAMPVDAGSGIPGWFQPLIQPASGTVVLPAPRPTGPPMATYESFTSPSTKFGFHEPATAEMPPDRMSLCTNPLRSPAVAWMPYARSTVSFAPLNVAYTRCVVRPAAVELSTVYPTKPAWAAPAIASGASASVRCACRFMTSPSESSDVPRCPAARSHEADRWCHRRSVRQ